MFLHIPFEFHVPCKMLDCISPIIFSMLSRVISRKFKIKVVFYTTVRSIKQKRYLCP